LRKYKVGDVVRIENYPKNHYKIDGLHAYEMYELYGNEVKIHEIDKKEEMFRAQGWWWRWCDIDEPIECLRPLPAELFEID
jgi:hypothetical protein